MNLLKIGFDKQFDLLPGALLIDDEPTHDARIFDPTVHSFNPLRGITKKRARDLAATIYSASPEGKDTLTVRNGRRALARMLYDSKRLDRLATIDHIDHDRTNSKLENLRLVLPVANMKNRRRPRNGRKNMGVRFRNNAWEADIKTGGKSIYLGRYKTEVEAIEARARANEQYDFHPNHGQDLAV